MRPREAGDREVERRAHERGPPATAGVVAQHHDEHADEHQAAALARGRSAVHHDALGGEGVGHHPVEQVARLLPVVEAERELLQVRVERGAQVVDHALADVDREVVRRRAVTTPRARVSTTIAAAAAARRPSGRRAGRAQGREEPGQRAASPRTTSRTRPAAAASARSRAMPSEGEPDARAEARRGAAAGSRATRSRRGAAAARSWRPLIVRRDAARAGSGSRTDAQGRASRRRGAALTGTQLVAAAASPAGGRRRASPDHAHAERLARRSARWPSPRDRSRRPRARSVPAGTSPASGDDRERRAPSRCPRADEHAYARRSTAPSGRAWPPVTQPQRGSAAGRRRGSRSR